MLARMDPPNKPGVLEDHPDVGPQLRPRHLGDVLAVERDPAAVELVEPHDQVHERGLARPVGPTMATVRPGSATNERSL